MPEPLRPIKITLHCAEGRYAGVRREFTGEHMLTDANGRLYTWSREAPKRGGGYDKVDCWVEVFETISWYMRLDLQSDGYITVGKELLRELRFWAGEANPTHVTKEQYAQLLRDFPKKHEIAKAWLASLDLKYLGMDL